MTATYQEILKKSYIQRLRNQQTSTDLLNVLDAISEDYLKEVATEAVLAQA